MLWHVIDRVARAACLDAVIVATTTNGADAPIHALAAGMGVHSYAGSADDVLTRTIGAAQTVKAGTIVRITSDCPLIDPDVIDLVFARHQATGADYTANVARRTFPRGLDVEIIAADSLQAVGMQRDLEPRHREHVTPYLYEHPERFGVEHVGATGILRRPEYRLCVDTEADLRLVREVYRRFYRPGRIVDVRQAVEWLAENPVWATSNVEAERQHMARNRAEGIRQGILAEVEA